MRSHSAQSAPAPDTTSSASPQVRGGEWRPLKRLLPYLIRWRWRVALALGCMLAAKGATVLVPILLKHLVDGLTVAPGAAQGAQATDAGQVVGLLAVPIGLVVAYGLLRFSSTFFNELRELVFMRVTAHAMRDAALSVFRHLHGLALRFHLERQTGGLTSDIERGTRAISSLVSYTLYSIVPTLVEITLVVGYLVINYDIWFAVIALGALITYGAFTFYVTEWRTEFRRTMNTLDARANTRAVDSLINYETVKYFGNEGWEADRYDESVERYQAARLRSQASLSWLNIGQAVIISTAIGLMIWRATLGVVEGRMTLGDLVLVNAFMIQLYIPLNFLGVLYREIRQSLTDMERMFGLLDQHVEIQDSPEARPLALIDANGAPRAPSVRFASVDFAYTTARPILRQVDFEIPPGTTCAVVGASGAGKSTLSRLLFRFYDVGGGAVMLDGVDIRAFTQASLRAAIGIVPQDTVLFNDTIGYNIAYGRPGAPESEVQAAIEAAQLGPFVRSLPEGLDTVVGERGLKLSGGEKQRVAIARMLLKNPPVLVLDEATSALDSTNEQAIQAALDALAASRTVLVIAHRLSTVVHADQILVMSDGRIVERGRHDELLARGGEYARMWNLQGRHDAAGDL